MDVLLACTAHRMLPTQHGRNMFGENVAGLAFRVRVVDSVDALAVQIVQPRNVNAVR